MSWILLTTPPVAGMRQTREAVRLYGLRRRIEDWHRILKSGCKVETIAHRTGARIERAVAVDAVIAWRISTLAQLARTEPELPAATAFTDVELALQTDCSSVRKPPPPEDLGQAFRLVATMGGYLNRKCDGPPGVEIAWNGQTALSFTAWMLGHSIDVGETSALQHRRRRVFCRLRQRLYHDRLAVCRRDPPAANRHAGLGLSTRNRPGKRRKTHRKTLSLSGSTQWSAVLQKAFVGRTVEQRVGDSLRHEYSV